MQTKGDMIPDYRFAALMGELGCWMDQKVTKLTQVGTENCLVPYINQYLGLSKYPPASKRGSLTRFRRERCSLDVQRSKVRSL